MILLRRKKLTFITLVSLFIVYTFLLINNTNNKENFQFNSDDLKHRIQIPNGIHSNEFQDLNELIKNDFLLKPSKKPYNFTQDETHLKIKGGNGQPILIDRLFRGKKNGFFIEAGAFDGEYLSNTLLLELKRNWTGLLVEPNSKAFSKLITKNRKTFSIHSCLSVNNYPEQVTFESADVYGTIIKDTNQTENKPINDTLVQLRNQLNNEERFHEKVQCFPLTNLILALGNPRIDFLSLDVEGVELDVLKTIDFNLVDIRAMTVEVIHSDSVAIVRFLLSKGYKVYKRLASDIIFVQRKYFN